MSKKNKKKTPKSDPIKSPDHYCHGEGLLESWDAYVATYGREAAISAARFNIHKYLTRFDRKGQALQDLCKIQQYAEMLKRLIPDDYEWPV